MAKTKKPRKGLNDEGRNITWGKHASDMANRGGTGYGVGRGGLYPNAYTSIGTGLGGSGAVGKPANKNARPTRPNRKPKNKKK